ncbi:Rha family transcriptional regulator [Halalkalibacter sp. APA_J-10(15)]|uniref:Rha family transcriptional regulator n=1 Tax=Halalkalibacter sp. APA_J-10(15) TaxID=2933805 RepID=UPI001FF43190|nr:Rha family transcriptional regulator [Halalkalibacter sp. APA_J-10(15)]MCK0471422.1 Rha family transcriptional regulator [Halalkalibacter sp. APA_J-10(15)]
MQPTFINQLVYVSNDNPVTTSIMIAETFEKGHDKVLRDIRTLKCSDSFRLAHFGESTYTNKQGRVMPMYVITFDGFAMLAMGYTGKKAIEFKEKYINAFNRTRQLVESRKDTLLAKEQKEIQSLIRDVISNHFPRLEPNAKRKYYTMLHMQLKREFNITSFRDIPRHDLGRAVTIIKNWHSPNLESRNRREYIG